MLAMAVPSGSRRVGRRQVLATITGALSFAGVGVLAACGTAAPTTATTASTVPATVTTAPVTVATTVASSSATTSAVSSATVASAVATTAATTIQTTAAAAGTATTAATATAAATVPATGNAGKAAVTIRYTTFWPQYRIDILKQALTVWDQQNPDIKLQLEPNTTNYRDKLLTDMSAGSTQDTFQIDVWTAAKYFDTGQMLELSSNFKRDNIDLKRDYGLIGLEFWCGKQYVVPYVLSPHAWYYNKTMLKQYGAKDPWDDLKGTWTWADMLEIGQKVTTAHNASSRPQWGFRLDYNSLEYQLSPFIQSNGGRVYDVDKGQYTLDTQPAIDAVQFVMDLVTKYKVIPTFADRSKLGADVTAPFGQGYTAMEEDSTGRILLNNQLIKEEFAWDIAPVPIARPGMQSISHFDGDPNCVYAHTKYPDEAYQFAKFLGGPVTQGVLSKNKLLLPALYSAAYDPNGFLKPPPNHLQVFADVARKTGIASFYQGNGLQATKDFTDGLNQIAAGKVNVADGMRQMNQVANSQVQLGQCRQFLPHG
jgi:multiple sugar transport system substrate-binding protein